MGFGSGQGVKCYHSEHLYGEFWHRAFIVAPDTPLCNYLISCGANVEASGGVVGVWRHAKARVRGMKRVQVEPHLSVTGACSAQWVPIKPKTDAAFLYALIHVLLHELPREQLDLPFLGAAHRVAVPGRPERLLPARSRHAQAAGVGPGDRQGACRTTRPASPRRWRAAARSTRSRSAPTTKCWPTACSPARPSFTKLLAHMQPYSPEWAEGVCDVQAGVIRQIAHEYSEHACVGQTIEIDGKTMPYRPVAVSLGKTVNNGWGGFECCWARTLLACLVGALEVPGGTIGTTVRLTRPMSRAAAERQARARRLHALPAEPDRQGALVAQAQHPQRLPHHGAAGGRRSLEPGAGADAFLLDVPGRHARGPAARHAARRLVRLPHQSRRSRSGTPTALGEKMARFPFVVAFAYTRDETNHFADVLLPDATDLESLQLIRIGGTKYIEQFWDHQGFALRQPVVAARGEARDFTDIATELAQRTGLTDKYNAAINKGAGGVPLKGEHGDFSLDPSAQPQPRGDLGRGVPRRERRAERRRRRRTGSTGGRSTAWRPSRSRAATGTCSRRWSSTACASSCPTRSG